MLNFHIPVKLSNGLIKQIEEETKTYAMKTNKGITFTNNPFLIIENTIKKHLIGETYDEI